MATEAARLYAVIGADIRELKQKLDEATREIGQFRGDTERAGSGISGFFSSVASTATGVLSAGVIQQIGSQIAGIGRSALEATAQVQSMEIGLVGLLAKEISRGDKVTETYQVMAGVSDDMAKQNDKLAEKQATLTARLQNYSESLAIATQRLEEYRAKKNVATSTIMSAEKAVGDWNEKIAATQAELAAVNAQLDENAVKASAMVMATRTYYTNQMSIAEAMPEAEKRAKALMDELARIAILSPYQLEIVQGTFRQAMAFGYTADEAKKVTEAMLNVAAGVGAGNEQLGRMAYNFAQIRMVGKVTAMDVRQLAMAGLDLNDVLRYTGQQMGITINDYEDFNKALASGQVTWEEFTEMFAKYAQDNFGGASERMSVTLLGLKNTFGDLFTLTMPSVLMPAMEEVNFRLSEFLNLFLDIRDSGVLEDVGQALKDRVVTVLAPVDRLLGSITRYGDAQKELRALQSQPFTSQDQVDRMFQLQEVVNETSYGLGVFGVVLGSVLGPEVMARIRGPLAELRMDFGRLRDALSLITQGNWREALERLELPEWVLTAAERGVNVFGRLQSTLDLIGQGQWRAGLAGLGFSPEVINGISQVGDGLGKIWDTITRPFEGVDLSGLMESLFAPNPAPEGMPDWVAEQMGYTPSGLDALRTAGRTMASNILLGLTEGLIDITTPLLGLTKSIKGWTESENGVAILSNTGHAVGEGIIAGIDLLFGDPTQADKLGNTLAKNLLGMADNMVGAGIKAAQSFMWGLVAGIFEKPLAAFDKKNEEAVVRPREEGTAQKFTSKDIPSAAEVSEWLGKGGGWEHVFKGVGEWLFNTAKNEVTDLLKEEDARARAAQQAGGTRFTEEDIDQSTQDFFDWLKRQLGWDPSQVPVNTSHGPFKDSSYATGGSFITNGPRWILVGDNPGGRERVDVTPLSSRGSIAQQSIVINIDARGVTNPETLRAPVEQGVRSALRARGGW